MPWRRHQRDDVLATGAEGEAHADFAHAPQAVESHHAVEADDRERQRQGSERAENSSGAAWPMFLPRVPAWCGIRRRAERDRAKPRGFAMFPRALAAAASCAEVSPDYFAAIA